MKKNILTLAFCTLFLNSSGFASSWHYMLANQQAVFYFDADTVVKDRKTTTLWTKSVEKPDQNGLIRSSAADRIKFNCSKNTFNTLTFTMYRSDRNAIPYILSEEDKAEQDISTSELISRMAKIVCEANFPRGTSNMKYFKIPNNDVYQFTRSLAEDEIRQNTPPE